MAKWDNMLAIVWLLQSRNSLTAEQISEHLEMSVRTVYRYIDSLCASGVPIIADSGHDGGYRLVSHFREVPLFFEPNEQKSLFHAATFARGAGYPYEKELTSALQKIRYSLSDEQKEFLERHMSGFDVLYTQKDHSLASLLQQLEHAVAEGQSCDILYDKRSREEPSERRIDPYGLVYREKYWYVIAFCHLRKAMRTFRVDRIQRLWSAKLFFERPDDFSVQGYFDQHWGYLSETMEPTVRVHIRGDADRVDYICGYFQHCIVEHKVDEAYLQINVDKVEHMLPEFLISFGTTIEVIAPQELRAAMRTIARKLVKYYE